MRSAGTSSPASSPVDRTLRTSADNSSRWCRSSIWPWTWSHECRSCLLPLNLIPAPQNTCLAARVSPGRSAMRGSGTALASRANEPKHRSGQEFLKAEGVLCHELIIEEDVGQRIRGALLRKPLKVFVGVEISISGHAVKPEVAHAFALRDLLEGVHHVQEIQLPAQPPDEVRRPLAPRLPGDPEGPAVRR